MTITLGNYWPLLALLAIPFLWWMRSRTATGLSALHLTGVAATRTAVVVFLALALARPIWHRAGKWISVVYALDVSASIDPSFLDQAIDWIATTSADGEAAHARFIAFAGSARSLDSAPAIRTVRVSPGGDGGSIDQSATNLEAAVAQALRSFDPRYLKRLVIISDGNENAGDLTQVLGRARELGVRVFTMPATVRGEGDSWIEAIDLPDEIREQEPVASTVRVFSRVATHATIELLGNGNLLEAREVDLEPGINPVSFELRLPGGGPVTISGRLRSTGDPFPQNDRHRQAIWVGSRPRILYVEGFPASSRYLRQALEGEGMEVTLAPPSGVPTLAPDLESYDLVLLSDVPRQSLSDPQMDAILSYVRDDGGGLIFAAGDSSYGEEGYADSLVEEALPIWFRINEKRKDLALVIVLDKSFSMVGPKIELSKEAAKAALQLLEPNHRFGLVTFDHSPYWTVPLQLATNKPRIEEYISSIIASAHTNIYPALEKAYESLLDESADVRHVILLSDGKTYPDDYEALATRMVEAEITVSTVAVGEEADRELLDNIARWGGGRSYFIRDAQRVPQVFIEETQRASQATLVEEPVATTVTSAVEAFRGIDFATAPSLRGYVSTQAKDTAEVLLQSETESPILARWHYGLGKSAVFTSDVKNRWAIDWLEWEGYGKFWSQLVRETMRRDAGDEVDFGVERVGNEAVVTVSVITEEGEHAGNIEPQLEVVEPGGAGVAVSLDQVGPGTYRAKHPVHTSPEDPYLFRLSGVDLPDPSRALFYPYADEFRLYPPNLPLLRAIAEQTGGKLMPDNEEIYADYGEYASVPTPLWPALVALALIAFLLDIAVRRAPWFWKKLASAPSSHRTR